MLVFRRVTISFRACNLLYDAKDSGNPLEPIPKFTAVKMTIQTALLSHYWAYLSHSRVFFGRPQIPKKPDIHPKYQTKLYHISWILTTSNSSDVFLLTNLGGWSSFKKRIQHLAPTTIDATPNRTWRGYEPWAQSSAWSQRWKGTIQMEGSSENL